MHALLLFIILVWDIAMMKIKERSKTSNWIAVIFLLTFVNLFFSLNVVLPCMTLWIGENWKFGVNTIISLTCIKQSWVSLWEPQQNNLTNPEVYSEPCQAFEIACFVKIVIFFVKYSILDVWQNSEYISVI